MTDYFALLDQPRRPWLDPDKLKQAFHAKSLHAHPDAQRNAETSDQPQAEFAVLNEAYQVLSDPKRRLHHLLTLEGHAPSAANNSIPAEVEQLFPAVAALMQEANALVEKGKATNNPLTRSLIKPQILRVQKRIEEMLETLRQLHENDTAELRQFGASTGATEDTWSDLQRLYFRFSYVTRWTAELQEQQVQLSLYN